MNCQRGLVNFLSFFAVSLQCEEGTTVVQGHNCHWIHLYFNIPTSLFSTSNLIMFVAE